VCAELGAHGGSARTVAEEDGVRVYAPWGSAGPYQLRAAPLEHAPDAFAATRQLAVALRTIATRYAAALGTTPWNAWLCTRPLAGSTGDDLHWHVEAYARVTVLASLELGAGLPVCVVDPESAAHALRG
jgi:galactose-1-phosphate uridylyltransferase